MIQLTALDGSHLTVNDDVIATIYQNPYTVLVLTTGERLLVRESAQDVIDLVIAFRRRIASVPAEAPGKATASEGSPKGLC